MGYQDALTEFADATAVTVDAISDVIDLGSTNTLKNLGAGEPLYLVIQVDTAFTSSGTPTATFSLESDSTAALSSATVHWTGAAHALAALTAGATLSVIALPDGQYQEFVGVRVDVGAGGPMTAGAYSAYLTYKPQAWQAYADAL